LAATITTGIVGDSYKKLAHSHAHAALPSAG